MGRKRRDTRNLPAKRDISRVTPKMQVAARLDAQGFNAVQIEEMTKDSETSVSRDYVRSLRAMDGYKELRLKYHDELYAEVNRIKERVLLAAVEAGEAAIAKLVELLNAVDNDGRPLIGVQAAAAKELLNHKAIQAVLGTSTGDEDDGSMRTAAVNIHLSLAETLQLTPPAATLREHPDIIDGEVT